MNDDFLPRTLGLMFTQVNEYIYVTTLKWTSPCGDYMASSYESMIHYIAGEERHSKLIQYDYRSIKAVFHAHLGIVRALTKKYGGPKL